MKRCYNCTKELDKRSVTKEHIPAKANFVGFSNEYKVNRITVPACYKCNQDYSTIDQEIRDAIGIMNENNEMHNVITEMAVSSLLKQKNANERLIFKSGIVLGVVFDREIFKKLHIKNFKGIFYYEFGLPISNDFIFEVILEEKFEIASKYKWFNTLYNYVSDQNETKVSGHRDIFEYKLKKMNLNENNELNEIGQLEDAKAFVGFINYLDSMKVVILAIREEFKTKLGIP